MTERPQYSVNYTLANDDPREWARRREDEGWDCLAITDHLVTDYRPPFPHLWVSAGAVATVTSRVRIQSTFVNGVFRHPADTAQAARQMQQISDGRFELGIGAGWYEAEMTMIGHPWPEPRDRAGALAEAVQIIRPLLAGDGCQFHGEYYDIDVPSLGPDVATAPPLVASVGGPRTIREVTPHVDRIEVKPNAPATRGGGLDWDRYALVTDAEVVELVGRVRSIRPDVPVDMFIVCNAADDEDTRARAQAFGDRFGGRFFGPASKVAENVARLSQLGIGRVSLSPLDPTSLDRLAPLLLA